MLKKEKETGNFCLISNTQLVSSSSCQLPGTVLHLNPQGQYLAHFGEGRQ